MIKHVMTLVCGVALWASVSSPAFAQTGIELDVGFGGAVPVSPDDFEEQFDPGFAFSADVTGPLAGILGWRGEFGFDRTSVDGADLNTDFIRFAGGVTVQPFESDSRGRPYGFFTVGGFTADMSGDEAPDLDSETDVGISFGGGYTWDVNDTWGIGGNVRINGVFIDDADDDTLWYVTPSGMIVFRF